MEVVLGRLALDVAGLVRQVGARRVDLLAARLEDSSDRMLSKPIDLQVGMELPQLLGDRDVPLRVAEADRRRDVQSPLAARTATAPAAARPRRGEKVPEEQVHLDGIACLRVVT